LFIDAFNNKKPMTIVGDGSQSRDFIHVNDVVEANIFAAITENKKTFGQTFNVGSGKNYSIISIAKMIGGDYNFIDPRAGEAKDTLSNNEKIYNLLGWKPSKDIIDYIKEKINVN
jgi:UDP-glucose 4-epimerase